MHHTRFTLPADNQPGGQPNQFCPNCGHPVAEGDTFCENCGYNLKTATPEAHTATAQPKTPTPQRSQRRPMTKKTKRWGWGLSIIILLLVIFGIWGNHYYSRQATLNRVVTHLRTGKNLTTSVTTNSSALKLTNSSMKPLSRYYQQHPKALATLKAELENGGVSSDETLTYGQNGHHLLFFPKYQLTVNPVRPTITTNHKDTVIKLDGKKIATANSDYYSKKLPAMVPGQYTLASNGTVSGHQITNKASYHITTNATYDLSLKTISVTFKTLANSTVYLNGKKLGAADSSGLLTMKDEPWSQDMKAYATYKVGHSLIKTKTANLTESDDGYDVALNYPGLIDKDTADDLISDVFSMVDDLANEGDDDDSVTSDDDSSLPDYFMDGTSNSQYQELVKMAEGYYKDDDVDSVDMDTTVKDVAPGTDESSLVTYTVKYTFYHDDDEHIQVYAYTATVKPDSDNDSGNTNKITKISAAQKISDTSKSSDDD